MLICAISDNQGVEQAHQQRAPLQPYVAHQRRLLAQHRGWQTAWLGKVTAAVHPGPAKQAALPGLDSRLRLIVLIQDSNYQVAWLVLRPLSLT